MIPFNTNLTGVAEKRQPLFILSDLHHTGDRAAAGEFARDLALVQPAVGGHKHRALRFSSLGHGVQIRGHKIGDENLICITQGIPTQ